MGNSLLTIDISTGSISALLFSGDRRSLAVSDSRIVFFDNSARIPEKLTAVLEEMSVKGVDCRVGLSAEFFFFRTLTVPFVDRRQVAAVIGHELQDNITLDEDAYTSISLPYRRNEHESGVLAVLLEKSRLIELLTVFRHAGIDPELVTVSGLTEIYNHCRTGAGKSSFVLVNMEPGGVTFAFVGDGAVRLIRSIPFERITGSGLQLSGDGQRLEIRDQKILSTRLQDLAGKIRNTVVALRRESGDLFAIPWFISGRIGRLAMVRKEVMSVLAVSDAGVDWQPFRAVEERSFSEKHRDVTDTCFALAGLSVKESGTINFRKDEFLCKNRKKGAARAVRLVGAGLFLVLIVLVMGAGIEFNKLKTERDQITDRINEVYRTAVPEGGRIVDAVQQLTIRVNELKNRTVVGSAGGTRYHTVLLLADISKRLPKNVSVIVERFIYDRKTVRIKGLTDTFNAVDQMKRYLDDSPFYRDITIVSATVDTGERGVKFELRLQVW